MKVEIKSKKLVDVVEMRINLKVRDEFRCTLYDKDGNSVKDYEGYVPNSIVPGEYGDYLELHINIDTGQILNWKKPVHEDLREFIEGDE